MCGLSGPRHKDDARIHTPGVVRTKTDGGFSSYVFDCSGDFEYDRTVPLKSMAHADRGRSSFPGGCESCRCKKDFGGGVKCRLRTVDSPFDFASGSPLHYGTSL